MNLNKKDKETFNICINQRDRTWFLGYISGLLNHEIITQQEQEILISRFDQGVQFVAINLPQCHKDILQEYIDRKNQAKIRKSDMHDSILFDRFIGYVEALEVGEVISSTEAAELRRILKKGENIE